MKKVNSLEKDTLLTCMAVMLKNHYSKFKILTICRIELKMLLTRVYFFQLKLEVL